VNVDTYFKPLRRKVGIATLVLACVCAVGWVRSLSATDAILIPIGDASQDDDTTQGFWSSDSGLNWGKFLWPRVRSPVDFESYNHRQRNEWGVPAYFQSVDIVWQWRFCGFGIGFSRMTPMASVWVVPYWSVVGPLTLLSAWLLLSKPRQSMPRTPAKSPASVVGRRLS
jgi:hypothetical protein